MARTQIATHSGTISSSVSLHQVRSADPVAPNPAPYGQPGAGTGTHYWSLIAVVVNASAGDTTAPDTPSLGSAVVETF